MQEIIDREMFIEAMEKHWEQRLGNVSSHALRQTWRQIGRVFNEHIANHDNPFYAKNWNVLQPKTGTGKTQGTIVYCSLLSRLPDDEHPGVLIVTRRIKDADHIKDQINLLAGREVAVAHHSDSKTKLSDIAAYPVVVITHRFYEIALDQLGQGASIEATWPYLHRWENGERKLIVIDECIDIVEQSHGSLMGLKQTLAAVTPEIEDRFPDQVKALEYLIGLLKEVDQKKRKNGCEKEAMVSHSSLMANPPDFSEFRKEMWSQVRYDWVTLRRTDLKERDKLRKRHEARLKSVNAILRSWAYYAKHSTEPTLNTARLLVPEDVKGAVILDATASSNVLLDIWKDARIETPYQNVRTYHNVALNFSKGHKVGKNFMTRKSAQVCKELIADLNRRFSENDDVLIVTQKDVEPVLMTYETKFNMKTAHWGLIDGSNEWKNCNKVVVFGLPFRPDTWSANLFMAFQGPRSTAWLQSEGKRPHGRHVDIRQSLMEGAIIADVIQAINRVRCRKVIDEQGNCEPTSIWILLPKDRISERLLDGISRDMPGIRLCEWDYEKQKSKTPRPRRGRWEASLTKYLMNMASGSEPSGHIKNNLDMSARTMASLAKKAQDRDSELHHNLRSLGVRYEVQRTGRTQRGLFIKD